MEKGLFLIDYEQQELLSDHKNCIYSNCLDALFTKNGKKVIVIEIYQLNNKPEQILAEKEIVFFDISTQKRKSISIEENRSYLKIQLSNAGKYIQTLQKVSIKEYYISIFETESYKKVLQIPLSNQESQRWPNFSFTENDKYAFILDGFEGIKSYETSKGFQEWKKFPVKNCEELSISPGYKDMYRIAAVVPEV